VPVPASAAAAPPAAAQRWCINPAVRLHWRLLDADWVVLDAQSGMTHQLDGFRAAVLMAFEAGDPLDLPGLQRQVQSDLGLETVLASDLALAVQQLCRLDLLLAAGPHNPAHVVA
jgi:hypothetical protein